MGELLMHQAPTSPTQRMRIIRNLSHLGHYLYITRGCRGGQQFILTALYRDGMLDAKDLLAKTKIPLHLFQKWWANQKQKVLLNVLVWAKDRKQTLTLWQKEGQKQVKETQKGPIESFWSAGFICSSDEEKTVFGYLRSISWALGHN